MVQGEGRRGLCWFRTIFLVESCRLVLLDIWTDAGQILSLPPPAGPPPACPVSIVTSCSRHQSIVVTVYFSFSCRHHARSWQLLKDRGITCCFGGTGAPAGAYQSEDQPSYLLSYLCCPAQSFPALLPKQEGPFDGATAGAGGFTSPSPTRSSLGQVLGPSLSFSFNWFMSLTLTLICRLWSCSAGPPQPSILRTTQSGVTRIYLDHLTPDSSDLYSGPL